MKRVESRSSGGSDGKGTAKSTRNDTVEPEPEASGTSSAVTRIAPTSGRNGSAAQDSVRRSATSTTAPSVSSVALPSETQSAVNGTAPFATNGSDVNEFLARARAMGLNLTRQDYERARAGVSAFLRAERISSASNAGAAAAATTTTTTTTVPMPVTSAKPSTTTATSTSASAATNPISDLKSVEAGKDASSAEKSRRHASGSITRTASGTTLSFFTAVLPTKVADVKTKPRLDDISSLQERRRRRERRRRLREKAEREANDADCETGSHRCHKALSEPADESPMTSMSTDDTPLMSADRSPSRTRRTMRYKSNSLNIEALARVGLGITGSPLSRKQSHTTGESSLQSPNKALAALSLSPVLSKLTRKAHVNAAGHLLLLPSPIKASEEEDCLAAVELILQSAERMHRSEVEEEAEMVAANAGGETDDSGVCLTGESVSAKKDSHSNGSPSSFPHHRRRVTSYGSSNDLDDGMDKLTFLERIMEQKRSPLRLRKEAKARERQARLAAANNDLVVMTAMASTSNPNAAQGPVSMAPMPPPMSMYAGHQQHMQHQHQPAQNLSQEQQQQAHFMGGAVGPGHDQKSVRWAADFSSPRKRMTTKEIYDFEFYGIAPNFPQQTSALMAPWESNGDADTARRALASGGGEEENGHQRMRSHFGSTNFGSPVATRSGQSIVPDSPGMLSMSLNDSSLQHTALGTQLLAKRGLLFGGMQGTSNTSMGTPGSAMLDGALSDMTNIFSHGPTLARSPVRKGLIETETPPRLARANTLATPISLAHSAFGRESNANHGVSPERATLVRAHSSSQLERQGKLYGRASASSDSMKEQEDKENQEPLSRNSSSRKPSAPTGWANRTSSGEHESTISPAAIFGMYQQSYQPPAPPKASGRRPAQQRQRTRITSTGSGSEYDRQQMQHSASEVEGDDERDPSPLPKAVKSRNDATVAMRNKAHARNSSISTTASAYDDSPLMLDTRSNKATVVVRPTSGNSLARAVDMPSRSTHADGSQMPDVVDGAASAVPASQHVGQSQQIMEWDKPDMSRVVKLVSEELQAALDSGALTAEPAQRFYKLPRGWGKSLDKPQNASYAGMIGQAILSSSDGRLSLNEIYNWISSVFPYFERGDRGWQNSIRHNLSLNKSFIKVERDSSIPGKGGWWAIKEGHEERFRAGNYYAPGTAKASKESQTKTPKLGAAAELPTPPSDANGANQMHAAHKSGSRKRISSERPEASDGASDSDSLPPSSQLKTSRKRSKKAKSIKSGREAHTSTNDATDGAQISDAQAAIPVTLVRPDDAIMRSSQGSMVSPSPKQYDTITPSRPYAPGRVLGTSSSDFGSAYASSIMAGMPVLTDASSPPSSPNNAMPPPAGGVRGAASSQSAQKQHATTQLQQGSLTMSSFYGASSSTPFGMNLGSYSQHAMPASPLAHMRNSSNNGQMSHGASLTNGNGNSFGKGRHSVNLAANVESPLRVNDGSPSRMLVNSPPVSNVRDSASDERRTTTRKSRASGEGAGRRGAVTHLSAKSPARLLQHSPVRSSPLRPAGAATNHHQQQSTSMMLSPAGLHLQMALGHQAPSQGGGGGTVVNGPSSVVTYSSGSSTPQMQRWGIASSSPSRRMGMDANIFSPGQPFLTPNAHGSVPGGGLDDPFDYGGHLQHELDMASELQMTGMGHGEQSPMKGFESHAFGSRTGIAHSLHYMSHNSNNNNSNTAFGAQQQQQQQQSARDETSDSLSSYNPFMQSHG